MSPLLTNASKIQRSGVPEDWLAFTSVQALPTKPELTMYSRHTVFPPYALKVRLERSR